VTCLIGVAVDGRPVAGIIHQPFYSAADPEGWWGDRIAREGGAKAAAAPAAPATGTAAPLGRNVWGVVGVGVFGLGPAPSPARDTATSFVVCTSRSKRHPATGPALAALEPALLRGRTVEEVRVGAAGHHLLGVLEGRADLYVQFCAGCKRWDTCAGEALLRARGGALVDAAGVPYSYGGRARHLNHRGLLAALSVADVEAAAALVAAAIAPFPPPEHA
jgi:3'(2'), 5'-bisphosphate nucleotidase